MYSSLFNTSFLDSLKSSLNNDPGVFDSLSVSSSLRFSGFFENKELEGLPGLISVFIKEGQNYSFSPVLCEVEEYGSCFLIYKYNFFPSQKKDLTNSWFEIEKLALANKKNHQFNLWINEKKENLFVKTNNSGSSFGVTKVKNKEQLKTNIENFYLLEIHLIHQLLIL